MDSVMEDDPTLPLDLEKSTNLARFKEAVASANSGRLGLGEEVLDSSRHFQDIGIQNFSEMNEGKEGSDSNSSQVKTMRDYELQMSDLKKENFGLKLRIYFLEERLKHSDTPEDTFKLNIELKVTVEELKKELVEKQQLLIKASDAVEMIANHSDAQIKQLNDDHLGELRELAEKYEGQINSIEKELVATKHDLEDVAERLTEAVTMNQQLNEKLHQNTQAYNEDRKQETENLNVKDKMIDELNDALENQRKANKELENKTCILEEEKKKAQDTLRKLVEGEKKLKNLAEELNKRNTSFEELKEKTKKLEKINRELKNQLHESERQQLSSRNSVDNEEQQKFKTKIGDLEKSLAAARESAHTANMKWYQTFEEHSEIVRSRDGTIASLQNSLAAKDKEIEKLVQSVSSMDIELQRLTGDKQGLQIKIDEILKEKDKEITGLAKQLKELSNQCTNKTIELEENYRKVVNDAQEQVGIKDRIIEKLTSSNSEKDKIIEDIIEALKVLSCEGSIVEDTSDIKDTLLKKLQNHIKQKERAVQVALDEKFSALEEKDNEMQQLRQAIRERDRLIEKINSAVVDAEQQAKVYEQTIQEKEAVIQQLKRINQDQEISHKDALNSAAAIQKENDTMFQKVKSCVETTDKELVELKKFVQDVTKNSSMSDNSLKFQDLTEELKEKNSLLERLLQERTRMMAANESNSQRLMAALREKDILLKDASEVMSRVQTEKNSTIQNLQRLLNNKEHELQSSENNKAWVNQEQERLIKKLRAALKEKDKVIEQLVEGNKDKDQLLMDLQESLRTPKKQRNLTEVAVLQQTVQELEAALRSKKAAIKKLQEEYKGKLKSSEEELQNVDSANQLKIQNLQQELKAKETMLQQSKETIENLHSKLKTMPIIEDLKQKFGEQNQALLEAQKAKEQAQMELAVLKKNKLEYDAELKAKHDNIDMLSHAAHIKDEMIQEMQQSHKKQLQDMQDNVGYYQRKAHDLETSNDALRQQLSECSELNNSLQRQLDTVQSRVKTQSPLRQDQEELSRLREEVIMLRAKVQLSTPQREQTYIGARAKQMEEELPYLQKVLQGQVEETVKLNDILMKEREMYINIVQNMRSPNSDANKSSAVSRELQTLKALRSQLEDGIHQNTVLRNQLQDQITSQQTKKSPVVPPHSPYDAVYQREIQELKSRLEDTERWNASLQARLNHSMVDGKSKAEESQAKETAQKLEEQVHNLTRSLDQTTTLNNRLNAELDKVNKTNQKILAEKDAEINRLSSEITTLHGQLDTAKHTFGELDNRLKDANVKLEYYARNVNGDFEDILLEREIEVDSLRGQLKEFQLRAAASIELNEMAAQTSPFADKSSTNKLSRQLAESQQWNENYKRLLEEKDKEIQRLRNLENSTHLDNDMVMQKLRKEYETGIQLNEDLKKKLEMDIMTNSKPSSKHQSPPLQIQDLHYSVHSAQTDKLRNELQELYNSNQMLNQKLMEVKNTSSELALVKRELKQSQIMNEQLGKQLADVLSHVEKLKSQNMQLKSDVDDKKQQIDRLNQEIHILRSSPAKHTSKSQTSPSLSSPPAVTRKITPPRHEVSPTGVIEKMHKLNQTLMAENQFLRNKLKQNERYATTLKDELELYNRMKKDTTASQTATQQMDLAAYMNEMRELRMRLEESINTNDKLRAQLEKRMAGEDIDGAKAVISSEESLQYINDNERLRAELLAKDKANDDLKEKLEEMSKIREMEASQLNALRQQVADNHEAMDNLQNELRIYEQLYKIPEHHDTSYVREGPRSPSAFDNNAVLSLLAEIRRLRQQLEKSITTNNALREKLEEQLNRPMKDSLQSSRPSLSSVTRRLDMDENMNNEKSGLSVHGHVKDFIELQNKVEYINNEATKLLGQIKSDGQCLWVRHEVSNIQTLATDCKSLLSTFIIDDRPETYTEESIPSKENVTLRQQISKLKKKLAHQEDVIKRASLQLEASSKKKEGLQTHLIDRLLESQSVLQRARGSLEDCARRNRQSKS
ncbi:myomegalin isoform X2 [Exaiptasia diaphana]|uniref:Centrosomin N-terminal motif 1 domain-containing protein n=1 Tax=Exaiptasia diaphana TaxID=2652724 RepID=A0A913YIC7_EXADI|nr:myomegalin isoform X2 [Exaiptasia diaphana]